MDVVDGKIVAVRRGRLCGEGSLERWRSDGGDWAATWAGWSTAPGHGPARSSGLEPGAGRWSLRPAAEGHACRDYSCLHSQFGFGVALEPESEPNLDQMMAMFESQITRAVPSRLELDQPTLSGALAPPPSLHRSDSSTEFTSPSAFVGASSDLKRKRSETTQVHQAWNRPLKLLLRKGLSLSDVGEHGRIIIPKKSAETQFQRLIDAKEGTVLEMHDYNGSKRWLFRFKWWINNKSRMYVLENTGEFVKYHGLKEHDIFIVYEDDYKKKVVRGLKGTDVGSFCDEEQALDGKSSTEKIVHGA